MKSLSSFISESVLRNGKGVNDTPPVYQRIGRY